MRHRVRVYLFLLIVASATTYLLGIGIAKSAAKRTKWALMALGVAAIVAVIVAFKANLLIGSRLCAFIDVIDRSHSDFGYPVMVAMVACCTLQLYAGLAGYTNIALGIGKIFGIEGPPNFNAHFARRIFKNGNSEQRLIKMSAPFSPNTWGLSFHHLGLAVQDPQAAAHFLTGLGYRIGPMMFDPLQNVHLGMCTHDTMPGVEIISPAEGKGPLDKLLSSHKDGLVYHMCYTSKDLARSLDALEF